MFDKFSERHIGVSNEKDLKAMLDVIGVKSVDELISQVIPQSIRLRKPLALPAEGMSEYEFAAHIRELADRNQPYRSFIGMGYYPSAVPAVVTRNVFENPAWYTSYTPYQAEISQGRLEALLNFQTAVISLTGMEIGNCSLLDEGTAAAEAMAMMFSLRSRDAVREGRNQLFVDRNIFPQTLDVLLTRSEPFGIELIVDEYDEYEFTGREFGAIVQYPAADGRVRDYSDFTAAAHAKGALVTVAADLLSLALLKAPGEWGADIAVGSAQRLGTPMGFGGPAAGYMTTREAFKRNMPGRIIGVSVDRLGNKALRMALQILEHLHRLGPDGLDDGLLLRLQRSRRAAPRGGNRPPGRRNRRPRAGGDGLPPRVEGVLRHARSRGRGSRRAVAGARTGHQLLLSLRRARAHVVRRGDHRGGDRDRREHLRRSQRQESQGGKGRHRKLRPNCPAPPIALFAGTRIQRLPLGERPDALHQEAGVEGYFAGQFNDLFRFVHHEAQRRGAHAAALAGRLPEHAPLRPGRPGQGLYGPDRRAGTGPGDDHRLRGLLVAAQFGRGGRIHGADGHPRLPPEPRTGS